MRDLTPTTPSSAQIFTLALWGLLFCAIAMVIAYYSDHSRDRRLTPESALERLRGLAGSGSRNCGAVPEGGVAAQAYACAEEQARRGRPYWMAFYRRGEGALVVVGLARGASGKTYLVHYIDDLSGRGGRDPESRSPYLAVEECRNLRFLEKPGSFGYQHV